MKFKRFALATVLLASSILASCNNSGGTESSSGEGPIPEGYIRVYFYRDFSQPDSGEYLSYQDVKPGSKIKKPADPTPLFTEFPVFLGWSYKEVIKDTGDLWNFDTDVVVPLEEGANTYEIYAIWSDQ